VASQFPLSADWLAPISYQCSRHSIEMDKPLILAYAAETGFLKSKFPLNVKIKYQRVNAKGSFDWYNIRTLSVFVAQSL
jgi:hypothetical protein